MKAPRKIVEVTWADACADGDSWHDAHDLEIDGEDNALCHTIGFVTKKTKSHIHLIMSYALNADGQTVDQSRGRFLIPMGMVKSIRVLK